MARRPKTKDARAMKRQGSQDLAGLVNGLMDGSRSGRPGAESHGFEAVKALIQVYLVGEGVLADELRAFVTALMDAQDALRRDIPPEAWSALWPTLNTLVRARKEAEKHMAQFRARTEEQHGEGRKEGSEGSQVEGVTGPDAGAGVLGAVEGGAP